MDKIENNKRDVQAVLKKAKDDTIKIVERTFMEIEMNFYEQLES